MNKIGIIKDVDNLGRVVIPKEYRSFYNLGKSVEIIGTDFGVVIRNPEYEVVKKEKSKDKSK